MAFPCYHIATPSKALLVSGRKNQDGAAAVYLNQGKFVNPLFKQHTWRSLESETVTVQETCPTKEFVDFNFTAAITYSVKADEGNIRVATTLYPDDHDRTNSTTGRTPLQEFANQTLVAHLRSVAGGMEIRSIMQDRKAMAKTVQLECEEEMGRVGLEIKSFRIQHIADVQGSTYLQDLSAASRSSIKAAALIAEAQAQQQATEKEQESQQAQAIARRATAVKTAQLNAEIETETQKATQAGPLALAQARQEVIDTETETARREVELVQQRQQSQQIKPAEARRDVAKLEAEGERQRIEINAQAIAQGNVYAAEGAAKVAEQNAKAAAHRAEATIAEGNAEAQRIRAVGEAEAAADLAKNQAAAAEDKISVEMRKVDVAPEIVRAAAEAFQGSNQTYFNGAEGGMQQLTSLAALAPMIFNVLSGKVSNGHSNGQPNTDTDSRQPETVDQHF